MDIRGKEFIKRRKQVNNNLKYIYNSLKELYTKSLDAAEEMKNLRIDKGMSVEEATEKYNIQVAEIKIKLETIDIFMRHIFNQLNLGHAGKHDIDEKFDRYILKIKLWDIDQLK